MAESGAARSALVHLNPADGPADDPVGLGDYGKTLPAPHVAVARDGLTYTL